MPVGRPPFSPDAMRRDQNRAYAKVRAAADKVKSLTRMVDAATKELHDTIGEAANKGIPHNVLAELSGMSEGRVWQIIHDWQPAGRKKKEEEI